MTGLDAAATPGVLAERVRESRARLGRTRLVCIDGPAGSGKTTTAARLAERLRAQACSVEVVHLDDLYAGWSGLEGSLWPRLSAQVLEPVRRGRPGRFQRFDWITNRFAEWVDVPVPTVLVIEGCGAARRACDALVSLRVWVEAPADLRLRRGLDRDGEAARPYWERWMQDEARHFAVERTSQRADIRLDAVGCLTGTGSGDGAAFPAPGPGRAQR